MNIQTANRLVALRKERGYSQEELASKIGVSRQAVSKWERAEASPDTDNLILLARLYQVSLDELLAISDIPAAEPNHPEEPEESEERGPSKEQETDESDGPQEDPPERLPFEQTAPPAGSDGGWGGDSWSPPPQQARLKLTRFPYPVLVTLIYLILGFTYSWWHPGWLLFLTIPFYYWLAAWADRR